MLTSPFDRLERVLAIRLDNIGDVVMTGPALRALRQVYPNAQITLMASPGGTQVAPLLPWIDDVFPWRAIWQDIAKNAPLEPEKEYALVEQLAGRRFDAAFIFTSFSQSPHPPAYACYLARIPIRVGQSKEFGGGLLTHWVRPPSDNGYQVERNLHLLREVDIPVQRDDLELRVPPPGQRSAEALLAQIGIGVTQPFVALAPGASAAARRYDPSRFAEMARRLTAETGLPLVIIGSQREAAQFTILEELAAQHPRIHWLVGQTSVIEMAHIINRAALLIANNSGSMHMAAAFHRPMVILYSGTETFEQWVPHTSDTVILNRPTTCAPCHGFQCPYHMECLDIPADEVAEAAIELLRTSASSSHSLSSVIGGHLRR